MSMATTAPGVISPTLRLYERTIITGLLQAAFESGQDLHDLLADVCAIHPIKNTDFLLPEHCAAFDVINELAFNREQTSAPALIKLCEKSEVPFSALHLLVQDAMATPQSRNGIIESVTLMRAERDARSLRLDVTQLLRRYESPSSNFDPALVAQDLEEMASRLRKTSAEHDPTPELKPFDELLKQHYAHLLKTVDAHEAGELPGVPTGIQDLDQALISQPGDLVIIAGRPGMGKTALALAIACGMTMPRGLTSTPAIPPHQRKVVVVFTLEMSVNQYMERIVSNLTGIEIQAMRAGTIFDEPAAKDRNIAAMSMLTSMAANDTIYLHINPMEALTPKQIIAKVANVYRTRGRVDAILVDYLQLLDFDKSTGNRASDIGDVTRQFKMAAGKFGAVCYLLSQLNRGVEQRPDKRPLMSDLRESGAIEQDADSILFAYRDEYYNPDSMDKGVMDVILGKYRNGPTTTVKLLANLACNQIRSIKP